MQLPCRIFFLITFLLVGILVQAQPRIGLRMSFNTERNQYEVFATPNFSARNFTWGPSQVSVVLPASSLGSPLPVKSTVAGTWVDNSLVANPKAAPQLQFHGVTTSGGKVDMTAGEEFLLFDFTLPTGYVAGVRLFHNANDPGSSQPGMLGGDFRSYMSDEKGADYLTVESVPVSLSALQDASAVSNGLTKEQRVELVAYPNPTTGGTFRLFLNGFSPDETVTLHLFTVTGVDQQRITDKVSSLVGRTLTITNRDNPYWILSLERMATHETLTQKIWLRD